MHSPLPDSSALEAGIIEDERPSRLSRVQDNVRNLLRTSLFGSVHSTPESSPTHQRHYDCIPRTPLQSPLYRETEPQYIPTPSTATTSSDASPTQPVLVPGVLFPPQSYQQAVQQMAHQSTMFNTRAVAALQHPDLSDPSLAIFLQQKADQRQRKAWKRSRSRRHVAVRTHRGCGPWLMCVLIGLVLAALLSTYLALATTSDTISPTFHILFILAILLTTIIFAHTLVRLCIVARVRPKKHKFVIQTVPQRRRHHHHHHPQRDQPTRAIPAVTSEPNAFVPPTPIPVHVVSDEIRPDTAEARPTATVEDAPDEWDKEMKDVANPPPAYGRWRGSVRANPDLLHWQVIPSPVDTDVPDLPSPTYEEAQRAHLAAHSGQAITGPPSYVTRDSPARRREVQEPGSNLAQAQAVEPEMFEVRNAGSAM